ncbi:hypothetical protein ACS0TY_000180 [Phlomoides rotata]
MLNFLILLYAFLAQYILALLADALLKIQEQVDADNENSDWEETQNRNAGDDVIFCSQLMLHHITDLHMNI